MSGTFFIFFILPVDKYKKVSYIIHYRTNVREMKERCLGMDRIILHSDMNSFYASVECMLIPELKNKAVAVGGSVEDRHGIILAKSELAKKYGVQTGDTIWEAERKCKDLIIIPPHYEQYQLYSSYAHEIYQRFTDLIEPFGLDECWLDVTGSTRLFGSGYDIACQIKETIKHELGLTVSIGVSFNKIFAKLGSDLKKPDAITVISRDNFKEKVWPLKASDMLGVGRATYKKLEDFGIITIGDLAKTDVKLLKRKLGKCGVDLWTYANGNDVSRVRPDGYKTPAKSIGHGITCASDLMNTEEVWKVLLELSQTVSHRLKEEKLSACGVQISVKDNQLFVRQFQAVLPYATQSAKELAEAGIELFSCNYKWQNNVRAITIRAINLQSSDMPIQLDLFSNAEKHERQEVIDNTVMDIRRRFGDKAIQNASLLENDKLPKEKHESVLPSPMFK